MRRALVVTLWAMLANACASNIDVRWGWTQLAPVPYQVSGQVQTARNGDLLFRQEATAAGLATLDTAFSYFVQGEVGNVTTTVPAGARLYRLTSRAIRGRLYCTLDETVASVRTRLPRNTIMATVDPNARTTTQACFVDNDSDGHFEELTSLAGQGALNSPGFGGMMVLKYDIEPIAYSPSTVPDPRTSSLGVRLEDGRLRVVGIVDNGAFRWRDPNTQDGPYLLTNMSVAIPRSLPATVDVSGARIEVLSRDGDSIRHRLVNGFPPDQVIDTLLQ